MNTDNQGIILALDIGTNNTCGSFINPYTGKAEIIEVDGLRSVPSFFGYNRNGEEIIGLAAKKKFCDGISEVIGRAKYLMGKQIPRDAIEKYSEKCGVEIGINQEEYCYFHLPRKGVDINPSELYKRMINLYVSILESKHIGRAEKIRITVPASFNAIQRDLVKRVAEECGFESENISLLNEPSAAAYMYWHEQKPTQGTFLVYDFGGGTFDLSLVGVNNGVLEVLDHDGDPELGGCDIDKAISNEYQTEIEGRNLPIIRKEMPQNVVKRIIGKLLLRCEESKIRLGETFAPGHGGELVLEDDDEMGGEKVEERVEEPVGNDVVTINIADIIFFKEDSDDEQEGIEYEYEYELTREELIHLSQPYINKTVGLVRDLLEKNHLQSSDISSVIVVGGSSLLPSVKRSLETIFHPRQILDTVPPKEVVSLGACYSLFENYGLKERSTYSLGVEMRKKNHVQWLIPKNAPLPYQCDCTITTTEDYQTYIVTNLVQGNSEEVVTRKEKNLIRLGSIYCEIKTVDEKGKVPFDVTYIFESDGCVHVRIVERDVAEPIFDQNVQWKDYNVCSKIIPLLHKSFKQSKKANLKAMLSNGWDGEVEQSFYED